MSAHPARCDGCHGCGHQPGPPILETVNGLPHVYTTVKPCEHDWWRADHGWQPEDEPLTREHPSARAAFERGYAQGLAELDAIRNRQPAPRRRTA